MSPPLQVSVEGTVGRLTLNRPEALHALTMEMCQMMTEALLAWRADRAVSTILIDHAGPRGFCAGGDIRMLAESGAGDGQAARRFFFVEYRLNHLLFVYPKPVVVVMDGITMGGGVGLAAPARYRIATERTTYAMPETGIGLFPDVGGGWFLPRMPGHIGLWLALTGARLKAADCLNAGIATHVISSEDVDTFKAGLIADPSQIEALLGPRVDLIAPLQAVRTELDAAFSAPSVETIFERLAQSGSDWALAQLQALESKSPQTLKVAFRQLQAGSKATDFADHMALEYAIGARVVQRHDFLEGVRAVIVDKDNAPNWSPKTLAEVTPEMLDQIFAPLPADEAWSPLP